MCKYCEQKAVIENDSYFDLYDNSIKLVGSDWTTLYIGVNAENKIVLRASGDDYTDDFIINFCPICGRDLRVKEGNEMKIKACPKCGSENLTLESKGKIPIMDAQRVALRCANCDRWIKWCPKEERDWKEIVSTYLKTEKREVTKECQDKFINFSVSWAMNNISKTVDMWLIPRIKEAKDREDIRYCQGMLDAISDFLTEELYREIQDDIYRKRLATDK